VRQSPLAVSRGRLFDRDQSPYEIFLDDHRGPSISYNTNLDPWSNLRKAITSAKFLR
jgi:hypothetical protein